MKHELVIEVEIVGDVPASVFLKPTALTPPFVVAMLGLVIDQLRQQMLVAALGGPRKVGVIHVPSAVDGGFPPR